MSKKVFGMVVVILLSCVVLAEAIDLDSLKRSEWRREVVAQIEQDQRQTFLYHPLLQTLEWTADPTDQENANFGYSVSSAGDVNNDGYSDVIIGASWWNGVATHEGRAYVYHGSSEGLSTTPNWTADPTNQASAGFGVSVSSAGDVNNDGYSDVIIGAPWWNGVATNEGRAYVYHGSSGGLSTTPNWTADPTDQASAGFGVSVSSAGDVNNDGYSDVIIGAPWWNGAATQEGRAYVYHGSSGGLSTTPSWTADPTDQMGALLGRSVSSAGDVNNDGYSDVVIGAYWWNGEAVDEGRAYVYHGSSGGLSATPNWTADPTDQADALFGYSVSSEGDVNNDGFSDVIVGAPWWDGEATSEGRAYVYHGSPGGLSTTPGWTADPTDQDSANFGYSVSSAGDVNNDEYSDVIIGAHRWDGEATNEGRAYVYHGSPGGLSTTPGWTADPTDQEDARFGRSVSSAGDVNHRGYSDLIIGAHRWDGEATNEGRAYVYHGEPPPIYDVGTASVDEPPDTVACDDTVLVAATVCNYGNLLETFDVEAIIESSGVEVYADTQIVIDLNRGDCDTVSFANWVVPPVHGVSYAVTITTLLPTDIDSANDTATKTTISWCPAHDVGPISVDVPPDTVPCEDTVLVAATVCNYGKSLETFEVEAVIDSSGVGVYADTQIVADLDPGACDTVSFANWVVPPVHGVSYAVTITTLLPTDVNHDNDSYTDTTFSYCLIRDVGVVAVVAPADTVFCDTAYTPEALASNFGQLTEHFMVEFLIDTSATYVYAETSAVITLARRETTNVTFTAWTAPKIDDVNYHITSSTICAQDVNPANDTLIGTTYGLCPVHDGGVVTIDSPPESVNVDSTYTPSATVHNYGNRAETFDAICTIDGYTDTSTVNDLLPDSSTQVYFEDWSAPALGQYTICVKAYVLDDANATNDSLCKVLESLTHVEELRMLSPVPKRTEVLQNTPNPFERTTSVEYAISKEGMVRLSVYNAAGRVVKVLVKENRTPGYYTAIWNGRDENGSPAPSGIYFYKLDCGRIVESRKMVMVK